MAPSRSIVVYLLCVLALAALALEGHPRLERWLDWLLLPARLCAELAAPVGWMQGYEAQAGEGERLRTMQRELFEHQALEAAVLDSALAPRSERHAHATYVHAEVVGRAAGQRDTLIARVLDGEGLALGLPVVTGDWFVGFVSKLDFAARASNSLSAGQGVPIEITLITSSRARVGAIVRAGPAGSNCQLVVGGVAPPRGHVFLDVHQPSQRWVHFGRVEVFEPESLGEEYSGLANGYQLGELLRASMTDEQGVTKSLVCVRPGLDYEAGLYQLLVLKPRPVERQAVALPRDVWEDQQWLPARLFLRAEPSPWREGRKLALGWKQGVGDGAALVSGVRLVGRVTHAAPYFADVRMLGDPGFSLVAVAMVGTGAEQRPHVLGRIIGRGREADGSLSFDWNATVPWQGSEPQPARVWTGSGENGVPRGLLLGDTMLPPGSGTHRLRIVQPQGAREPKRLSVRTEQQRPLLPSGEGG